MSRQAVGRRYSVIVPPGNVDEEQAGRTKKEKKKGQERVRCPNT